MKSTGGVTLTLAAFVLSLFAPAAVAKRADGQQGVDPAPQLVKDINPGLASSAPEQFVSFNGAVYFRATDGQHGVELWRTDGTPEGTTLVVDLLPGPLNGVPGSVTVANRSLYFHGFSETTGSKVFRSDGTAEGTQLLVDTFPGAPSGPLGPPLPAEFTAFGKEVLFAATDPKLGYELWATDGTAAGTRIVKDIHPGIQWSVPVGLTPFAGRAFFAADDSFVPNPDGTATFDRELFATDGTATGTVRLADINPGPRPSIPFNLTTLGRQLLFTADDGVHGTELWASDGTATGTMMLLDINPSGRSLPMHITVVDKRALFTADNGVTGSEVWVTDGSASGTYLVKDINPSGNSNSMYFTPVGSQVVFSADDGQNGSELWVTDGTEAGTKSIADINPGPANSSPLEFVQVGGRVFFAALVDADPVTRTVRTQLWSTDGTAEGTRLVWEAPGRLSGYSIRHLTLLGKQLLFRAPSGVDETGLGTDFELYSLPLGALGD